MVLCVLPRPFTSDFVIHSFLSHLSPSLLQGKDGIDVEVFDVLFKKLPVAAASMTSGGSSSLISRGVALLTRASGLCSDSIELWAIYADFMEKHARADAAAMLDIRLNAYRNCQKQGWASDAKAYPVVVGTGVLLRLERFVVFGLNRAGLSFVVSRG